MPLDPSLLIAGPRGRRLCFELLLAQARASGTDDGQDASTAAFWAAHALESGAVAVLTSGARGRAARPPDVSPGEAANAVARIAPVEPGEHELRGALAASVDSARYWQEPDGCDVLAGSPEFAPMLERVAEVVATSPHAAWWATPPIVSDQWVVSWDGGATAQDDPSAVLATWHGAVVAEEQAAERDRPADPHANWSGAWWSKPPTALVHSTRPLGSCGPAGLRFVEDSHAGDSATATRVLPPAATVLEIDGPDAWIDLCRRHPLSVTASKRHDWYRVTGRVGAWVQPDWQAVAQDVAGVHLSVAGYLATAGRLLDLGDGRASVVAGWNPDETYWFVPTRADGSGVSWRRVDDEWAPVGDLRRATRAGVWQGRGIRR